MADSEELDDTARAELWPKLLAQYPPYRRSDTAALNLLCLAIGPVRTT